MRSRLADAIGPVAALVLVTSGCASSGPYWDREDQAAARGQESQERADGLQEQLAAAQQRSASLEAEVERLEREIERLRAAATPPSIVPPEVPAARGVRAEQASSEEPGARQEIEQSDLDLDDDPGKPDVVSDGGRSGSAGSPLTEDFTKGIAAAGPATGTALYDQSLALLEQGHLAEAEAGFTRFLAGHPAPDLADNALFWLAESALRRADLPAALDGFRAVVERYPEGNKVPDALLKVGFCLAAQGDPASAATVYRELAERFPDTTAAETARTRLGLR